MNMDRKAFAGAAAVAAAILVVSPAKAAWNRASVVDVGGVPRFAIDGKPMTATAVMPSPAGKPGEAHKQLKAFRDAGAHVWIDTDDVFAAGRGYVMVHASSDGEKTIRLKRPCDVSEIFGASPAHSNVTSISEWMKRGETRVWKIVEKPCALVVPRDGLHRRRDAGRLSCGALWDNGWLVRYERASGAFY